MRIVSALCGACCMAAGAWAACGGVSPSGSQVAIDLLPTPKISIAEIFLAADANHDQRVTFEEAHSYNFLVTQAQFDTYDLDRNGYIDRAEAGLPPIDLDIAQVFEAADANNDQRVTFDELYAANPFITQSQFDACDANHDGCIDRAEAGLPPATGKDGCGGCSGGKSVPATGDLLPTALSLLGLAVMARPRRF